MFVLVAVFGGLLVGGLWRRPRRLSSADREHEQISDPSGSRPVVGGFLAVDGASGGERGRVSPAPAVGDPQASAVKGQVLIHRTSRRPSPSPWQPADPLPGALVSLNRSVPVRLGTRREFTIKTVEAGDDGRFSFPPPAPGHYSVSVARQGCYPERETASLSLGLGVSPASPITLVLRERPAPFLIAGRVSWRDTGAAASGVRVAVETGGEGAGPQICGPSITDEAGRFRLKCDDWPIRSVLLGHGAAPVISRAVSDPLQDLQFELERATRLLRGRVVVLRGLPLPPDFTLELDPLDAGGPAWHPSRVRVEPNGEFTFSELWPREYGFTNFHVSHGILLDCQPRVADLALKGTTAVELLVDTSPHTLCVKVSASDGSPLPPGLRCLVEYEESDSGDSWGIVPKGIRSRPIDASTGQVVVQIPPRAAGSVSISAPEFEPARVGFRPGQESVNILLQPAPAHFGRVILYASHAQTGELLGGTSALASSQELPGRPVTIWHPDIPVRGDRHVRFDGLPMEPVDVLVQADGFGPMLVRGVRPEDPDAAAPQAVPLAPWTELLQGVVLSAEDESPLSRAQLTVLPGGETHPLVTDPRAVLWGGRRAWSAPLGFSLPVAPGVYEIRACRDDRESCMTTTTVPGPPVRLRLRRKADRPPFSVRSAVILDSATGRPVELARWESVADRAPGTGSVHGIGPQVVLEDGLDIVTLAVTAEGYENASFDFGPGENQVVRLRKK